MIFVRYASCRWLYHIKTLFTLKKCCDHKAFCKQKRKGIEAFVEQLRLSLTQGDKVKVDGLGTFHITLSSEGAEKEKDCTVRSIRKVNVRFVADKALQLVNTSHATTRGENNVDFILAAKGDGEGDDDGNSGSGGNSGGSGEAPDPAA